MKKIVQTKSKPLTPTTERCFICMGSGYWGCGDTEKEAIKQFKAAGGSSGAGGKQQVIIIDAPSIFYVRDDTGAIIRHEDSPPCRELKRLYLPR